MRILIFLLLTVSLAGAKPIHQAAKDNNLEKAEELLLENPKNLSIRSAGATPLHVAAFFGRRQMVDFLLKNGADLESGDQIGDTALLRAIGEGHAALATHLMEKGADWKKVNKVGQGALMMAARKSPSLIAPLLGKGAGLERTDKRQRTALHHAVEEGNSVGIQALVGGGCQTRNPRQRWGQHSSQGRQKW